MSAVLITVLTKTDGGRPDGLPARARYAACVISTPILKRWSATEIIRDLRLGKFDVLVGINLLREGLDHARGIARGRFSTPTRRAFLRSDNSLIQTIGPRSAQSQRSRHPVRGTE